MIDSHACFFLLVTTLDKKSDPKHNAYTHLKRRRDRTYVIDLPAAQDFFFLETANRTNMTHVEDGLECCCRMKTKEREIPPEREASPPKSSKHSQP